MREENNFYDKIVYLLQGGGALGAYQVGVCQRLLDEDWQPDWIIGTSIGAINAAIIAGNKPEDRSEKLQEFWDLIATMPLLRDALNSHDVSLRKMGNFLSSEMSVLMGQPGFYEPRTPNPWFETNATPDRLSFYDTTLLKETLLRLVDFERLNKGDVRLTLYAICLTDGLLAQFDNTKMEITVDHVMASGALPPGFPAIKIEDKYYWDGGISSNTPLMALVEMSGSEKLVCFMVDLFSNKAENPKNMMDVIKRKKDLEFASRHHRMLRFFCEIHRLKSVISKLCAENPHLKVSSILADMNIDIPCTLNIIRLHYSDKPYELWSKDFEFSQASILERREAGYRDVEIALKEAIWCKPFAGEDGVQIKEY